MAQKKNQRRRPISVRSNDLLACALYHERHAREPLSSFDADAFKMNSEEKRQLSEMHLRFARAIRSILGKG